MTFPGCTCMITTALLIYIRGRNSAAPLPEYLPIALTPGKKVPFGHVCALSYAELTGPKKYLRNRSDPSPLLRPQIFCQKIAWENFTDIPVKKHYPLSLSPKLFECFQGLDDSPSWTCEALKIWSKSGKGMSEKLLSAPGMDIIDILWCHLVSLKLQPPSNAF